MTDNGLVQDQMISVPIGMETQQLDMLSNMLTDKVQNVSLKEAEEIIKKNVWTF